MPNQQSWFLPPEKPLERRLGKRFFKSLPQSPGVYYLNDAKGTPLYIGQSKCLRQRLASYKNAHPNHTSKRILRLINQTHTITWEVLPTPEAAILREDELLRTLKPRFNRANIYPEGYKYVELSIQAQEFRLREQTAKPTGPFAFGAFKGTHRWAFASLARLLFRLTSSQNGWWQIPRQWHQPIKQWHFPLSPLRHHTSAGVTLDDLLTYFGGESRDLVDRLLERFSQLPETTPFDQNWILEDLATLETFYLKGPFRNREITRSRHQAIPLIDALELNALLIQSRSTPVL